MEPKFDSHGHAARPTCALPEPARQELSKTYRAAVDFLFSCVRAAQNISTRTELDDEFSFTRTETGGTFHRGTASRRSASQFLLGNWGSFKDQPAVSRFADELEMQVKAYGGTPIFSLGDRSSNLQLLSDTVAWLGRNLDESLAPREDEVSAALEGIVRWHFDDLLPVREFACLSNFDTKLAGVELPGGVGIQRIPDAELARRVFEAGTTSTDFFRTQAQWRATWTYLATREEYRLGIAEPSRLQCLEAAIHLLGPGTSRLFDTGHELTLVISYNIHRQRSEEPVRPAPGFVLSESNESELVALYQGVYHERYLESLQTVRFLEASIARTLDDKVAKLVIALEGMFVRERGDQISYRLALRAAKTLRQSSHDRKEIFRRLKLIYGIRSDILHGGKDFHSAANEKELKRVGLTVESLPTFLEDLCRTALCRRLFDPASFEPDALDALVLSGL